MNKHENEQRYQLYCEIINLLDAGCRLINEYDSLPHDYGTAVMYQAESQIIHYVGNHPGVTANALAEAFQKTPSACSQLVRKLREKNWIRQERSQTNNRKYRLYLTDEGQKIFCDHDRFEKRCYQRTYENLSQFSEEQLRTYKAIQEKLNETFAMDVAESKAVSSPCK